jgi:uncharacterized protein involved in outer membrane biogenesis
MPGRRKWLRRLVWAAGIVLGAVLLYALAGYWAAPTFGRAPLERALGRSLGGTVRIGELGLDPLRLRVHAGALAIRDAQGRTWLTAERLALDLCACSAWRRAWVIEQATVVAPQLALMRDARGRLALPLPERSCPSPRTASATSSRAKRCGGTQPLRDRRRLPS